MFMFWSDANRRSVQVVPETHPRAHVHIDISESDFAALVRPGSIWIRVENASLESNTLEGWMFPRSMLKRMD